MFFLHCLSTLIQERLNYQRYTGVERKMNREVLFSPKNWKVDLCMTHSMRWNSPFECSSLSLPALF
jgi:hypothetical protein